MSRLRFYSLGVLSFLLCSCQIDSPEVFKIGSTVHSPAMILPALLSYSGCRELEVSDEIRKEIQRAREAEDDFKVLRESPEMIVVGYSENAARYFFKDKASCTAYTDNLSQLGWKKK